jgi:hypothetical protein
MNIERKKKTCIKAAMPAQDGFESLGLLCQLSDRLYIEFLTFLLTLKVAMGLEAIITLTVAK